MNTANNCLLILTIIVCCLSLVQARRQWREQELQRSARDTTEAIEECKDDDKSGTVCTLKPENLKPTQFAFGSGEVDCKKSYLESMSKSDLEKYLSDEKRYVVVIIGPDGFYLVDGHHLLRAVLDADIDKDLKVLHCTILNNWQSYSMVVFWERMVDFNYVWLLDEKGVGPISPDHLPRNIAEMQNDPFRTLAWSVSDAAGFGKVGTPFEDFMWGNFFRANIPLDSISTPLVHYVKASDSHEHGQSDNGNRRFNMYQTSEWNWCQVRPYCPTCFPNEKKALEQALPIALELANSPAASHLPGYKMGVLDPPKCG